MKLSDYINTFNNKALARENLALLVGCSEPAIRSWANGQRFPSRKYWDKIIKATDGKVTIMDMAK